MDYLISVSERTKQLVCNRGIRWNNHEVKYIGVNFAANKHHISNININSSDIALGYLGYMRHDKGYFFLLYMLENISSDIAKRIHLHLAAKCSQSHEIERLENLSKRLASITYFNGYNHKNINTILQNIELGIIPSLWEDCLPQVAYEYVCHGVPILVSDMGGAREISDNELFVYKAKSICSFEERLRYFADNKEKLNTFWDKYNTPNTVEKHCCDLIKIYTNNNCNS